MRTQKKRFILTAVVFAATVITGALVVSAAEQEAGSYNSFMLEGKEYTLPFDYTQFEADGWTTSDNLDGTLDGMTLTSLYMYKDGGDEYETLNMDILNGSGNTIPIREGKLCSIMFTRRQLDVFSFELPGGITPADDQATVTGLLGEPEYTSETDDYTIITYGDEYEQGKLTFCWNKDETMKDQDYIVVECYQTVETETSDEVPEYLSSYQAPGALTSDFSQAVVSLDGVLYQLPCPLTVFEENGWTLTEDESVAAGRSTIGTLEKDGKELDIEASNFADYQTTMRNCAVSLIRDFSYEYSDPVAELILPGNITFDSSQADLEATGLLEKDEQDTYINYDYRDYDLEVYYSIEWDKEENHIDRIYVQGNTWPAVG